MIHYVLNHRQLWTASNDFQQMADFLSLTVYNCRQFNADMLCMMLWICVIFGYGKVVENHC